MEKAAQPPTASYRKPRAGDLILLRDLARDKQHGRKLDPRWTEPRIVDRLSRNGMSAYIRSLHDPPSRAKRYHIDDLRIYVPRTGETFDRKSIGDQIVDDNANIATITYSRTAMGDVPGTLRSGQRAFDLSDLVSKYKQWK